jgi:hypothetical protein
MRADWFIGDFPGSKPGLNPDSRFGAKNRLKPSLYQRHSGHTVNLDAQNLFGWPSRRARNGDLREQTSFRRASIHAFFQTELEKGFSSSSAALVIVTSNQTFPIHQDSGAKASNSSTSAEKISRLVFGCRVVNGALCYSYNHWRFPPFINHQYHAKAFD